MAIHAIPAPRPLGHRSLNCLTHPLALLSIFLVLINDHILKWQIPSWFTGKLSDFSGLFFFPFLMIIPLAFILGRKGSRFVAPLSYFITGVIFIAIKTSPAINSFLSRLLSLTFSMPVPIALDPTDLWALGVLPLSWWFWIHQRKHRSIPPPSRKHWIVLALASVTTLATQPCIPIPEIARIVTSNSSFYSIRDIFYEDAAQAVVSQDGHTWQTTRFDNLPLELQSDLHESPLSESIQCNPVNPDRCYRISTDQRAIEASDDGGNSWLRDYRIPVERITYMKHLARAPLSCTPEIDLTPRDLALLPQGEGEIVVVAMGYQGVLLRAPTGEWERVAVFESDPLPLKATSLPDIFWILIYETVSLLLFLPVAWTILHAKGWSRTLSHYRESTDEIQLLRYALRPFAIAILLLVFAYLVESFNLLFSPIPWIAILLLIFGGPVYLGLRLHKPHNATNRALTVSRYSTMVLILMGSAWLPLATWALGLIPWYSFSLALALVWFYLASRFGWRWMKKRIQDHP